MSCGARLVCLQELATAASSAMSGCSVRTAAIRRPTMVRCPGVPNQETRHQGWDGGDHRKVFITTLSKR